MDPKAEKAKQENRTPPAVLISFISVSTRENNLSKRVAIYMLKSHPDCTSSSVVSIQSTAYIP